VALAPASTLFSPQRQWWVSAVLSRKCLLVLAASLLPIARQRMSVMACIQLAAFLTFESVKPYAGARFHWGERLSLCGTLGMTLLALLCVPGANVTADPSSAHPGVAAAAAILLILLLLALGALVGLPLCPGALRWLDEALAELAPPADKRPASQKLAPPQRQLAGEGEAVSANPVHRSHLSALVTAARGSIAMPRGARANLAQRQPGAGRSELLQNDGEHSFVNPLGAASMGAGTAASSAAAGAGGRAGRGSAVKLTFAGVGMGLHGEPPALPKAVARPIARPPLATAALGGSEEASGSDGDAGGAAHDEDDDDAVGLRRSRGPAIVSPAERKAAPRSALPLLSSAGQSMRSAQRDRRPSPAASAPALVGRARQSGAVLPVPDDDDFDVRQSAEAEAIGSSDGAADVDPSGLDTALVQPNPLVVAASDAGKPAQPRVAAPLPPRALPVPPRK
jgi:hypothetical protein